MVNRKFIVPYITTDRWEKNYVDLNWGGNRDKIEDVCKALCYITGTDYDQMKTLHQAAEKQWWGTWFEWGFFRCKGFKKGTMHFEFLDEDVWFKFNYEVAKNRGWTLPKKTEKKSRKKS